MLPLNSNCVVTILATAAECHFTGPPTCQRDKKFTHQHYRAENIFLPQLQMLMIITRQQCFFNIVFCSSCTCDDVRVYNEGIVGWVNVSLLVVLLAERERAAVHTDIVNICVASHSGLW